MKTDSTYNVIFLNNKERTPICRYCGKPLEMSSTGRSSELVDWYECTCDDWNETIRLDTELEKLNEELRKTYYEYERKFFDIYYGSGLRLKTKLKGFK